MRLVNILLVVFVAGACGLPLSADTLPITMGPWREDTNTLTLTYTYTTGPSGHLQIASAQNGASISIYKNGALSSRVFGTFDIEADINASTGQATAASISLTYSNGANVIWNAPTSSNIKFGAAPNFSEIDFEFVQVGPSVAPLGNGDWFAVEIFPVGGWNNTPSWTSSFSGGVKNDGTPLPLAPTASMGIGMLGCLGLGILIRRGRGISQTS
jgi:hypothetical protein